MKPTALQTHQLQAINISGAKAFVIEGDLSELKFFLDN